MAPFLASYGRQAELDDLFAERLMLRHGIPPEVVTVLRAVSAGFRAWGAAVQVTRPLADGGDLRLRDRTLRVLHRPGHSPSDTVFVDDRSEIGQPSMMLAADHLIAHISSNPLLARPLAASSEHDYDGPRPQALLTYLDSLEKTRAMELSLVLSGHGRAITDHVALIDERFRLHRRRAEKICRLIAVEPRTAHEIAQELWGNVAVTQAYLTLSEVLGHVDLAAARRGGRGGGEGRRGALPGAVSRAQRPRRPRTRRPFGAALAAAGRRWQTAGPAAPYSIARSSTFSELSIVPEVSRETAVPAPLGTSWNVRVSRRPPSKRSGVCRPSEPL